MKMETTKTMNMMLLSLICSSIIFQASANPFPHFFPNFSSIPPSLIPPPGGGVWDGFQKFANCSPGENIDGLAKLKHYFNSFGYINHNPSANFTDDFDDMLESAIRTYQKNFNLNVTGELDESTLKQIVKPRCGVADIVNGTTAMNSGKSSPAGNGVHTVAHYSFFPGSPRWPDSKTDLTYAFFPGNQLTADVKAVFARAFGRWSEIIPMTFTETAGYRSADIRIGFFSGDHGDGEAFDGVLGTLAHAFSPPSGMFHLDGDENWVIDGESASSMSAVDLESVAVHEIGHLLGLGHSSVEEAIMYPTISSVTKKVRLHNDDVEGIQSLYGSNPNYNGSSTGLGQERDSSGSRPNFVGLVSGPIYLYYTLYFLLFVFYFFSFL